MKRDRLGFAGLPLDAVVLRMVASMLVKSQWIK
jgi:hypothetical protein